MAVSWGTIKSLLLFFAPILLPKAIAYYRSVRAAPSIHGVQIRPVPSYVSRALLVLFVTAVAFLVNTLPPFAPENIFSLTQSRLQIPTDVLFTRLAALRPQGLSVKDELLRGKMSSLDSRLLYFHFGPDIMTECRFCNPDDPNSYLYYALPGILTPHFINLIILSIVTSSLFTRKEGRMWRTTAAIAAGVVTLLEIYLVSSYAAGANARSTRLQDIDFFFWNMRIYRSLALSALNAMLGYVLYLSSTNRAFLESPSTAERIENSSKVLDMVRSRMGAIGILRNTISRDDDLRQRFTGYWIHEGQLMGTLMEERDVVVGVQNALENRIDMATISADAEAYANNVITPLQGMQGIPGAI